MDIEKFKTEITNVVNKILEQHSFANIEEDVKNTLSNADSALSEMMTKLSESEKKLADSLALIEGLNKDKDSLTAEIATMKEDITKITSERDSLSVELRKIEDAAKEAAAVKRLEDRINELTQLKVVRSGDALEAQKNKIKDMGDEDYAAYRDELVSLRNDFISSIPTIQSSTSPAPVEGAVEDGSVVTPPADIKSSKATASLVVPTSVDTSENKIKDLSKAFQKLMDERSKRAHKE